MSEVDLLKRRVRELEGRLMVSEMRAQDAEHLLELALDREKIFRQERLDEVHPNDLDPVVTATPNAENAALQARVTELEAHAERLATELRWEREKKARDLQEITQDLLAIKAERDAAAREVPRPTSVPQPGSARKTASPGVLQHGGGKTSYGINLSFGGAAGGSISGSPRTPARAPKDHTSLSWEESMVLPLSSRMASAGSAGEGKVASSPESASRSAKGNDATLRRRSPSPARPSPARPPWCNEALAPTAAKDKSRTGLRPREPMFTSFQSGPAAVGVNDSHVSSLRHGT